MPWAARHPCATQPCPKLVPRGQTRCDDHEQKHQADDRERRGSAAARGYGARWQRYRLDFLRRNPLCVLCKEEGTVTAATVVDHIVDHKGDERLFWHEANHRALCASHHNRRTDAGDFGRSP